MNLAIRSNIRSARAICKLITSEQADMREIRKT
jgi:hypothetical protein